MSERVLEGATTLFSLPEECEELNEEWSQIPTPKQALVRNLLRGLEFRSILDLGCGPGLYAKTLPKWDSYLGVDQSEPFLSLAAENLAELDGVEFQHDFIEDFKTAKEFDLILCIDVLQHVPDVAILLRKIASISSRFYLINFLITKKEEAEPFMLPWGLGSIALTKDLAEEAVDNFRKARSTTIFRTGEVEYGEPFPWLRYIFYLLSREDSSGLS